MPGGEERELIYRTALGDVEAKLELVKEHLDLVVELAAGYAVETGRPFPQMVQVGAVAIVKAADAFHTVQQLEFSEHMRYEIIRAMEGIV